MEFDRKKPNPLFWTYRGWRRFFLVAALWNFTGAVPAIIWPGLNLRLFYGLENSDYYMLFLNRGIWWAVLFFGIGYLIVSTDPARHWGIIVMGIVGKTVIAVNWLYLFVLGKATLFAVLAALGDSAFTVYFAAYLLLGPRVPEEDPYPDGR